MRLRFVTGNEAKVREAATVLGRLGVTVVAHRAQATEIQADHLRDVAEHKARQFLGSVPTPFFVEDAGLAIEALGGFPGVYSRYAFDTIGCAGILRLLSRTPGPRRAARFEACVALVDESGKLRLFRGESQGRIARRERGTSGFGFDPIFVPEGHRRTFAELGPEAKAAISHRGRALGALARHLRAQGGKEKA